MRSPHVGEHLITHATNDQQYARRRLYQRVELTRPPLCAGRDHIPRRTAVIARPHVVVTRRQVGPTGEYQRAVGAANHRSTPASRPCCTGSHSHPRGANIGPVRSPYSATERRLDHAASHHHRARHKHRAGGICDIGCCSTCPEPVVAPVVADQCVGSDV